MQDHRGVVATAHAGRYLQQLCKHWGHRFTTDFDATKGKVDFGDGSSVDLAAEPERLVIVIHGPAEAMPMLEKIIVEHVDRFAHREALVYHWDD